MTGLVAQQQTVGPLQLPLSDVAVLAQVSSDFEVPYLLSSTSRAGDLYVLISDKSQ